MLKAPILFALVCALPLVSWAQEGALTADLARLRAERQQARSALEAHSNVLRLLMAASQRLQREPEARLQLDQSKLREALGQDEADFLLVALQRRSKRASNVAGAVRYVFDRGWTGQSRRVDAAFRECVHMAALRANQLDRANKAYRHALLQASDQRLEPLVAAELKAMQEETARAVQDLERIQRVGPSATSPWMHAFAALMALGFIVAAAGAILVLAAAIEASIPLLLGAFLINIAGGGIALGGGQGMAKLEEFGKALESARLSLAADRDALAGELQRLESGTGPR